MESNDIQTTFNQTSTLSRMEKKNSKEKDKKQTTNHTKTLKRLKTLKKGSKFNNKSMKRVSTIQLSEFSNSLKKYNMKERMNQKEIINLFQKGDIEIAQRHSLSNRPLKKLNEEANDINKIKYCRCCGLPCASPGLYEPFKMCDDTDTYSVLGVAISLYFSFYKFCIFILFVTLCVFI